MAVEAMIRRVPRGGTRSVKGLARQLGYLSRQTDPERPTIVLVAAQRHQFNPGTPDAVNPNDVWAFARRVYERSGRLPPDERNARIGHDLTMHFVISFPAGTDAAAAERAGRDWAESVFGHGFPNAQGYVNRHDYVTAFHNHGAEHDHPHMHVVVDRVPLGGVHLLTLSRNHPHWSYEAMRLQAVEAGANHGIELVATPIRTDMPRPITAEEAARRGVAAGRVPYYDPNFDGEGQAPGANEGIDEPTLETVRQTCEPVLVPEPEVAHGPGDDPGDDGSNGGGPGDGAGAGTNLNGRSRAPRRETPNSDMDIDFDFDAAADREMAPADDNGGEGPSVPRQQPARVDPLDHPQAVAGSSRSANSQLPTVTSDDSAEQRRDAQRRAERLRREQGAEDEDELRHRLPQRPEEVAMSATEIEPPIDLAHEELLRRERRLKRPARSGTAPHEGSSLKADLSASELDNAEDFDFDAAAADVDREMEPADDNGGEGPSVPRQQPAHFDELDHPRSDEPSDFRSEEQEREAQRQADRVRREQEADGEELRHRLPQRSTEVAMPATEAEPPIDLAREEVLRRERSLKQSARSGAAPQEGRDPETGLSAVGPSTGREGDLAGRAPAPISRLDAARNRLNGARAAHRTHRQIQPIGRQSDALDAWRIERNKRAQDVRQARREFYTALYGKPNVTTRAASKAQARAEAAQAQTNQRQASQVQREEEAQREDNLRHRTPSSQDQQQASSPDAATQTGLAAPQARAEQTRNERDRRQPSPSRSNRSD